jgi:GntR family transcriptional regulator/MocR family aminotransferase
LRLRIASGELPSGAALPSSRELARRLGVSRNTVITAYEELTAEGLVTGKAGSATRVAGAPPPSAAPGWREILRAAQFPSRPHAFRDPDGNPLYFHR